MQYQRLGDPFRFLGRLGFAHDDRNAVDEEVHIRADVGRDAVRKRELVGDVVHVGLQVVEVDQPDVLLPPLGFDEDRFQPLDELPSV
jgi:hypothetical protein